MSKATPWLLAGLAGVLVLLGGLALLAESPWARQLIERQLSQRLDGRAVSIGEFDIAAIEPDSVNIEVIGPRREVLLAVDGHFALVIDADLARLGRRTFTVQREHTQHETPLTILSLKQQKVRLSLERSDGN